MFDLLAHQHVDSQLKMNIKIYAKTNRIINIKTKKFLDIAKLRENWFHVCQMTSLYWIYFIQRFALYFRHVKQVNIIIFMR